MPKLPPSILLGKLTLPDGWPRLPAGSNVRRKLPFDPALADAVFCGGYYIVYFDENTLPAYSDLKMRSAQRRTRKGEQALQLALLAKQMLENHQQFASQQQDAERYVSRHTQLLQDLQTLVNRSNLIANDHESHLRHELDIARTQILRGGTVDDEQLLQTLHEIASLQGLSEAGSQAAGRMVADIINPDEPGQHSDHPPSPLTAQATPPQSLDHYFSTVSDDKDFYQLHLIDRFSAYDVAGVGGREEFQSPSFAKELMHRLTSQDDTPTQEQNSNELAP